MDLYILDALYRRQAVVDRYVALIWTERVSAKGDFELHIHSTQDTRRLLIPGTHLGVKNSKRVMTVETVEDVTDDEGRKLLKIQGPSLERVFEQRLAVSGLSDLTTNPRWVLSGTPKAIAEKLYNDICVLGVVNSGDVLTNVIEGSIFPDDTIDPPTETIEYSIEPMSLYQALKELCEAYSMGFRIVRDPETNLLYFDVYMGSDRTTQQDILDAVVFSPELENLRDTNMLTSIAPQKNVAYVLSPVGHEVVYPLDVDPLTDGFDRRVLFVRADDITDTNSTIASEKMIQRGKDALLKHRAFTSLDGEISQITQYEYGVDYNLGDIVELRDDDGATSNMRVTEQIFVSDAQGVRSYPTLTINKFVLPGSWLSVDFHLEWEDLGEEEYWENQP